jgi:DNA-binding NtrC family response regulator
MTDPSTVQRELRRFMPVPTLGVEVVAGPDAGRGVTVECESLSVGTAAGNALVLSDASVSRYHLELVRLERGVLVRDLGSTNGTMVAGVKLERGIVQSGAIIEIGQSRLRLTGGAEVTVELHGTDTLGELRGRTKVMRRLMAHVKRLASSDVPLLLLGESGTGKELIARAVHQHSPRAYGPFVIVDCVALVPNLVASELFGHEPGSFTGGDRQRIGAFEHAHGGTLFLDEVGELPVDLQTYLLGVLERRRFRRVGGSTDLEVDVRLVSATNRDLRSEVNAGRFRLDLYYRLAASSVEVPPLRERAEDIPLLIAHFMQKLGSSATVEQMVGPEAMERLRTYSWPGNVRELRNMVEVSLALGEALELRNETAPMGESPWLSPTAVARLGALTHRQARAAVLEEFERAYFTALLERNGYNVSRAAREADMNRSHLSELLHRLGLR